jgi:hypothetical protein
VLRQVTTDIFVKIKTALTSNTECAGKPENIEEFYRRICRTRI